MSSPLSQMARSEPQPWSRLCTAVAAASLLLCGSASAQTANDRSLQNPRVQAAYAAWRKLSQTEVDCIEKSLRTQRSSLWAVIQRGVNPSDAAGAALRAACRAQASASTPSRAAPNAAAPAFSDNSSEEAMNRAAAEKIAAEKAAAERAAAEKAAAEKAAAEKAAAQKMAAAEKAAEQAAADKAEAEKAAAEKAAEQAAAKAAKDQAVVEKATADPIASDPAKPEAAHAADATKAHADPAPPQQDAVTAAIKTAFAQSTAEARSNFVYGLISGPIIFCFGGMVFLLLGRRRNDPARADVSAGELDRLVTAVLDEQRRRDGKAPALPVRGHRADESAFH